MAPGESLTELMERVQLAIDNERARLGEIEDQPTPPIVPTDYTSRTLPEDVDCVEISPFHPSFMVVGSWDLVGKGERREFASQVRKGRIIVLPVDANSKPRFPGQQPPVCDQKAFPCAVPDLHFHPADGALLGVVTSHGQIHLFRLCRFDNVISRQTMMHLIHLGTATIKERNEHCVKPVLTQFHWLNIIADTREANRKLVQLVTCTDYGDVIFAQASFLDMAPPQDPRQDHTQGAMLVATCIVRNSPAKDAAWCVNAFWLGVDEQNISKLLICSGGDDSVMAGTGLELTQFGPAGSMITNVPNAIFSTRKAHNAGVTSLLALQPIVLDQSTANVSQVIPILSGSYDEHLRLFYFNPLNAGLRMIWEHKFLGCPWRLKMMDKYVENATYTTDDRGRALPTPIIRKKTHHILLISCSFAGAFIMRLVLHDDYLSLPPNEPYLRTIKSQSGWTVSALARFKAPHDSMVYACDFHKEYRPFTEDAMLLLRGHPVFAGKYTIVSTSFYDRRVCVWGFTDTHYANLVREREARVAAAEKQARREEKERDGAEAAMARAAAEMEQRVLQEGRERAQRRGSEQGGGGERPGFLRRAASLGRRNTVGRLLGGLGRRRERKEEEEGEEGGEAAESSKKNRRRSVGWY